MGVGVHWFQVAEEAAHEPPPPDVAPSAPSYVTPVVDDRHGGTGDEFLLRSQSELVQADINVYTDSETDMPVINILAGIASSDLARSRGWWTRLLGREPDAVPMPSDVEWHFASGAIQLVDDAENAGHSSVTLGVDDVDAELAAIAGRGLEVPEAQTVPSGQFRIALLKDPDGNTVVLGQTL